LLDEVFFFKKKAIGCKGRMKQLQSHSEKKEKT